MKQHVFCMSVKPSLKFNSIKLLCWISRNILKGFEMPTSNFLERSQFSQVFKNNLLILEGRPMGMGRGLSVDVNLMFIRFNNLFHTTAGFTGSGNSLFGFVGSHRFNHFLHFTVLVFLEQIYFNVLTRTTIPIYSCCPLTLMCFCLSQQDLALLDVY